MPLLLMKASIKSQAMTTEIENETEVDKNNKVTKYIIKYVEIKYHSGLSRACLMSFELAIKDYEDALKKA